MTRLISLSAGLLLTVLLGCSSPPAPVDRGLARETLTTALTAWQEGKTAESLKERSPPIVVGDPDWQRGTKLLKFEIDDKDEIFGVDLRCRVRLTLQSTRGQPSQKKVLYSVGTGKTLTVIREED